MKRETKSALTDALNSLSSPLLRVFFFSFFINLFVLAPSWYMLEVYGRVVSSRNSNTLLMLTIMILGVYVVIELLEWVRLNLLQKISFILDVELREKLFNTFFSAKLTQQTPLGLQPFNDFKTIKDAIPSPAVVALIDAPFAVITLIIIFLIHASLGYLALFGAFLQVSLSIFNEKRTHPRLSEANKNSFAAQVYMNNVIRNAQVVKSMGMLGDIHRHWLDKQQQFLLNQAAASESAGLNAALSKLVQTIQSSALLGFGCWLGLQGEVNMGGASMIIASTLGGRVLSPLVQAVTHWRTIVGARDAYARLDNMFSMVNVPDPGMPLPQPTGNLQVENLLAGPPGTQLSILKHLNFRLSSGEVLAVIGPSASGKSTLARLVVGIWPAIAGKVRLDGADVYAWNKDELGPYVGYLPQDVELLDGTLAENIARFGVVDISKVEEAISAVGLNSLIAGLPKGLDTQIGLDGSYLSGGQRQLVALARAIYDWPKLIVLDEPNSSLDEAGDTSLLQVLMMLKAHGSTVIVITHRQQILAAIDRILLLVDGQIKLFGTRDEVLTAMKSATTKPVPVKTSGSEA